ncbi:hypothetical protein PR202_ga07335 [Eleusine coracana subsp. coracana]|uniref:Uncharacterized protein n=1 Tax=Eleusine coracana subsp. coracana TaxID=191504 RepID=A0AAV5BYA3_ELECO|nr:hypothetical protein PR202_ga07335 [Eleusine coracana subsp. coracana]
MAERCDTYSAIVAEAVSGSHVIKIDGYSRIKELLENGKYVQSIPSSVGGQSWVIRYYPNGNKKEDADFTSLYLVLDSIHGQDVKATFGFRLLDKNHTPVPSCTFTSTMMHTFSCKGSSWGYTKFMKKENLEGSVHLRGDCFTISCMITVMKEIRSEETKGKKKFVQVPPSDLRQHLGDLLKNIDGTIVTFEVGGERFRAHRSMIAARSSLPNAGGVMKWKGEGPKTPPIKIDDMGADVFRNFLHFIYMDTLPQQMAREEDLAMAQHLLVAADRYNVERLKLI